MNKPLLLRHRSLFAGAVALSVIACGGKVVFVEDGEGGSAQGAGQQGGFSNNGGFAQGAGQQGGFPNGGGGFPNGQGGFPDGAGGFGEVLTCQSGCEILFSCGLQPGSNGGQNCPGFTRQDAGLFVPGCVETCFEMMALLSIIDPDDCEGTIQTIESVSVEFSNVCEFGFGDGTGPG